MLLIAWRQSKNFTVAQAAAFTGVSVGAFSFLERGLSLPDPENLFRIEGATKGQVTILDHLAKWQKEHVDEFTRFREAGRSSAKAFKPPAKTRKT